MTTIDPIPAGYATVTPSITIRGCSDALALYEQAFGATNESTQLHPDGRVLHATLRIGTSTMMFNDEFPEFGSMESGGADDSVQSRGGSPVSFWVYVEDCDAAFERAVAAGLTEVSKPEDMFWGDRTATVLDPFGLRWTLATRVEEVSEQEMEARTKQMFGG